MSYNEHMSVNFCVNVTLRSTNLEKICVNVTLSSTNLERTRIMQLKLCYQLSELGEKKVDQLLKG